MLAARSVRHAGAGAADAEVLPACWRVTPSDKGVSLAYAVEFEYSTLRANAPGLSDALLRRTMARAAAMWCRNLAGFDLYSER